MAETNRNIPLCVDLDGTLISGDALLESCVSVMKIKPWLLFAYPFWLIKGKTHFKNRLASYYLPNPDSFSYRHDIVDFLLTEKENGRKLVLATAAVQETADAVAEHLKIFDMALGTGKEKNLRSAHKAEVLCSIFGEKAFDYMGNSSADLKVWQKADGAILVDTPKSITKKAKEQSNVIKEFHYDYNKLKVFIKEIRVYQWLKNLLIFLPLLMAHKLDSSQPFLYALLGFISFSLSASSVYVLNDLMDLDSDRHHPRKRRRPIASGKISIPWAVIIFLVLLIAGLSISIMFLPENFTYVLLFYLVLTTAYSLFLKKIYIVDIFILSILYTIRIIAGALAVDVPASKWLLAFSVFIFLSLAIVKRYTELKVMISLNKKSTKGRGYHVDDIGLLMNIGPASGYLAVLVFALYIYSPEVIRLYKHPEFLWPVAICIMFWITRIWFLAHRGRMHDDPIVFTGKDYVSYIIGFVIAILVIGAAL